MKYVLLLTILLAGCAKRVPPLSVPPQPAPIVEPSQPLPDGDYRAADLTILSGPCDPRLTALVVELNRQHVIVPCEY